MCVRIQERHAVFRNEQRRVTLTPLEGSKVIVNGNTVSQPTELQHLVGVNILHEELRVTDHTHTHTPGSAVSSAGPSDSGFQLHLPVHRLPL